MLKFVVACVGAICLWPACPSFAQSGAAAEVRTPALDLPKGAIPLPVAGPLPAQPTDKWVTRMGGRRLVDVTQPTVTPFLPARGKATGAAVLVAPGGGFAHLAIDKEGFEVARWLAAHGIAAFVLKYRVRPADRARQTPDSARSAPPGPTPARRASYEPALDDTKSALRLLHERAATFGIDPNRIGIMGFSAGARLAIEVSLLPGYDVRPDFVGSIYGPSSAEPVPTDAPPLFAAVAADDATSPIGDLGLFRAYVAAKRPAELHVYERGGHGFGVPGVAGTTTIAMMDQFRLWLKSAGLLSVERSK